VAVQYIPLMKLGPRYMQKQTTCSKMQQDALLHKY